MPETIGLLETPDAVGELIAWSALALLVALLVHGRLTGRSTLPIAGMAVAVIAAALVDEPSVALFLAGLVPLLGLFALHAGRSTQPLIASSVAVALGGALPLVAQLHDRAADPALARVGLALLALHVALVSGAVPSHLWLLGLAERAPPPTLAAIAGFGGLAGLASLSLALERYPWLLSVVGARSLLLALGVATLALPSLALLTESRSPRIVILVGQLPVAAAWLALGASPTAGPDVVMLGLLGRAVAGTAALLALDAIARTRPVGSMPPVGARLLGPGQVALWVALADLVGLPPAAGFTARLTVLSSLAGERPQLAVALLVAAGVGLLGVRRVAIALQLPPVQRREIGQPTRLATLAPMLLSAVLLAVGLLGAIGSTR